MKFAVVGLSHETAPVELRERFAQGSAELDATLQSVRAIPGVEEVCVISTCNRVEYYVSGSEGPEDLTERIEGYLQSVSGLSINDLKPSLYAHQGAECIRHLFRVSSSLDSMVLGEPQILGQVKQAFQAAEKAEVISSNLGRVFRKSFTVAKRVRNETDIGKNAVSMSFAAVELGREIFDLAGKEVLLLGAGKMAALAAKHLLAHGVSKVRVASRTLATAEALAQAIGGQPSTLEDLPLLLSKVDIVICSTAAPGFVVDERTMKRAMSERRYRPILFVDIAVPRDVDPRVGDIDNCYVYDVDDLEGVLERNRKTRAQQAEPAEMLVAQELSDHLRWVRSQEVVPVIKALRSHATKIAQAEASKTLSGLGDVDKKTAQTVKAMSNAIINKLLHPVQTRLKEAGSQGDPEDLAAALTSLFDLDLSEPASAEPRAPSRPHAADPSEEGAKILPIDRAKAGGGGA